MPSAAPTRFLPALALLCAAVPMVDARAAVVLSVQQDGSNVVLSYSGTVNTLGLTQIPGAANSAPGAFAPNRGIIGATNAAAFDAYQGNLAGANSIGPGIDTVLASSATGDLFEIFPVIEALFVPVGYQSGAALAGTATWDNTTLAALGLTSGIYNWTWGSGANADSATLYLGVPVPAALPEPASLALAALGLVLGAGARRRPLPPACRTI